MLRLARAGAACAGAALLLPTFAFAQAITALPDQTDDLQLAKPRSDGQDAFAFCRRPGHARGRQSANGRQHGPVIVA